ncbi:hypothetical protein PAPYR_2702 [Paratrimastix pyriformis]|uniref:ABC transporter family G domain-containing protein n=1 Tax=Paratrimastix pyriformis TaxID=342808 RepID=A0ABQ8UPW3_9EUKA|nr:hypothetical protein PAPYR_2702 [Paratrimastix pyriformis]
MVVVIALEFFATVDGVPLFATDRLLYFKEAAAGLNPLAYYIAKLLVHLPMMVVHPLLFMVAYYMVTSPLASFGRLFASVLGLQFACSGLGYVIAMLGLANSSMVVVFVCVLGLLFSGLDPSMSQLKDIMGGFAVFMYCLSPNRWAQEAMVDAEVIGMFEYGYKEVGQAFLDRYEYTVENFGTCIYALAIIGIASRILGFILMVAIDRNKQQ